MAGIFEFVLITWLCLSVANPTEAGMDPHVRQEILQRLQSLRNKVKTQQDLINNLEISNAQQAEQLMTLRRHAQSTKPESTRQTDNPGILERLQHRQDKSTRDVSTLTSVPNTPTYRFPHQRIAFYALQYTEQTVAWNSVVHFDHELLNFRSSYDVMKGVFMSPLRGVYVFSVSISSSRSSNCKAEIVKNGVGLGVVLADSGGPHGVLDQGSITVVTTLDEGDQVWVQGLLSNQVIAGNRDTMFSGALIWELP